MIPKASQRGGGQQLATHLLNAIDNERAEVFDLRGSIANDIHGAFAEWEAASTATKCRKYLYSLSVNPDPRQRPLTRDEMRDFITRAEKQLSLDKQPRAIVFHTKYGREHCHVIWSRIDTDKMRAVQLSHDRHKLRSAVREFAREKGLTLPHAMNRNNPDRFKDRAARSNLAEKQQEERTGITKEQRRRDITALWKRSEHGAAFVKQLADAGYTLAQGNKRGHVIIDRLGEIHALARQIEGVKSKEIQMRLAAYPAEKLPSAQKVQETIRQKTTLNLREHFKAQADQRRTTLDRSQQGRRAVLDKLKADLDHRQRAERAALLAVQRDHNKAIAEERRETKPKGLAAFLGRITGIEIFRKHRQQSADAQRTQAQRENIDQLTRRQERERRELARQDRALGRVEKRETRSLATNIKREFLVAGIAERSSPARDRKPEQQRTAEQVRENARDITTPAHAAPHAPTQSGGSIITDEFRQALKERATEKKRQQEKEKDRSQGRDRGPRRE